MRYYFYPCIILGLLFLASCSERKEEKGDSQRQASSEVTGQSQDYNKDRNAYFGDLHVHTSWSFDAFIYNVRTNPDQAYEFGQGKAIDHFVEGKIQLKRALDFMAVSDHAEYMGVMKEMINPESPLSKLEIAQRVRSEDRNVSIQAFGEIGQSMSRNQPMGELRTDEFEVSTWGKLVEAAERHNQPGVVYYLSCL